MSRKFGFGKPSPGDDETTDAKGEKNEVSQGADAKQAVTPPLPANPLRHASDGAPADPTKGLAATDARTRTQAACSRTRTSSATARRRGAAAT